MPKRRYERQEPTHEWSQIRPRLKDAAQIKYELIRPVILWGVVTNTIIVICKVVMVRWVW